MKRFSILSMLAVMAVAQALACGPWVRPMYHVFSAYNRQQLGNTFTPRLEKYWVDYTGNNEAGYAMNSLSWVDPEEFDKSTNTIIRTAIERGDMEMQEYLRTLIAYLKASSSIDDENWQYPTKAQLKSHNTSMQYLHNRARAYTGKRLRPQYCLLAMRTLMGLADTQGIIGYWTKAESTLSESVYKDMMRNIYAGALLRTGKKKEACDIYAEQGDMLSLKWIMRDGRNLEGIKQEYARDPNAPTLVYLVQDFVNNGSHTLRAQYEYDWDNPDYVKASQNEIKKFITFANQVVSEGKTKVPALWQSAAGFLSCNLGNSKQGLEMLDKAMKMKGTERMLDNARVCRWVASMATADGSDKYQDYFLGELKWLQNVEKKEMVTYGSDYNAYDNASGHYTEVLTNVMYDIMPAKAAEWGNSNLATAFVGWMSQHEKYLQKNFNEEFWQSGDYKYTIDSLTADEMVKYVSYLKNPGQGSNLEKYLAAGITDKMSDDYVNDRIGTKLIREGRFEEAIPYLEKVSLGYIGQQAISFYMARRSYDVERWFNNQVVCKGEYWSCEEAPTAVNSNQKLDFCHDIVNLKKAIANGATGNNVSMAQLKYQMASMLYQASYKGQCWYISRYGQSLYDKACYNKELDFVAEAVRLLDEAIVEKDCNFTIKQNALYARAYIPFGSRYHTMTWDENYNGTEHFNKKSREYQTMLQLSDFVYQNRSQVSSRVTRCDVLRQFQRGTYKGFWAAED